MKENIKYKHREEQLKPVPVYTVGYGNRSIEQFIALLKKYHIEYLIDIRSKPYSKSNSQFSKQFLEQFLEQHELRYVFMGDTLGGRPGDPSCYVDGKVDYSKVREKDFYKHGINRIQTAWKKHISVVLMCAELKPQACHRSKLIGNTLCDQQIEVVHIDELGEIKSQTDINQLILGKQSSEQQQSLWQFDDELPGTTEHKKMNFSMKKYLLPEKEKNG